jgi:predicted NBD/HSP70 family sugar kinase
MQYHAGIDVSLELSSICVVDATGKIIKEARVSSDPAARAGLCGGADRSRIGTVVAMAVHRLDARRVRDGSGWRRGT